MRKVKPLTDKQISTAKPQEKDYRLYDGDGLTILITKSSKIWHFSYQKPITKSRQTLSLGKYPIVSLSDARIKRDEYRALLANGIDPQQHKKAQAIAAQAKNNNTFGVLSHEWMAQQTYTAGTLINKNRFLAMANEHLGNKPVTDITPFDLMTVLEHIAKLRGSLTADCVKTVIAQVLDYAIAKRMIEFNNARHLLRTYKKHKIGNHQALTEPKEFAALLRTIEQSNDGEITKDYLRLMTYLFVRRRELLRMDISDIDFEEGEWRFISPKTNQAIIVPLSHQAIDIIKRAHARHGQSEVFFGLGENAPLHAIQRLSDKLHTLHGFRASARTILEEVLEYPPQYIEMQLGHKVKDSNGTAYNRAKYLRQRKEMMQTWADYIDDIKKPL